MALVSDLLAECEAANHWANFGPLCKRLADEYLEHMQLGEDIAVVPCANAGIGLELMARHMASEAGVTKLRWIGPSYSFKNLGRGYFSDMTCLDCDKRGVLDIKELAAQPTDSYDGIIAINPFGMCTDFDALCQFSEKTGKPLLIDNAAGIARKVPNWPWQVFSLHQTKPYGVGEGGLMIVPRECSAGLRDLMSYGPATGNPSHWFNNAKLSDIACAFQIARLQSVSSWEVRYREQRARIAALFAEFNLYPLLDPEDAPVTSSLPIVFPDSVEGLDERKQRLIDVNRQYFPLLSCPSTNLLYDRVLNFPSHPDMALLSDTFIGEEIKALLDVSAAL